jgi:hypothetical protein
VAGDSQTFAVISGAATPVAHLLAAGVAVVLVDPDAAALARAAHDAGPDARLALLVGDPEEGSVRAAAEVMGAEVFGSAD